MLCGKHIFLKQLVLHLYLKTPKNALFNNKGLHNDNYAKSYIKGILIVGK